jgi:hypothetical protein
MVNQVLGCLVRDQRVRAAETDYLDFIIVQIGFRALHGKYMLADRNKRVDRQQEDKKSSFYFHLFKVKCSLAVAIMF